MLLLLLLWGVFAVLLYRLTAISSPTCRECCWLSCDSDKNPDCEIVVRRDLVFAPSVANAKLFDGNRLEIGVSLWDELFVRGGGGSCCLDGEFGSVDGVVLCGEVDFLVLVLVLLLLLYGDVCCCDCDCCCIAVW